MLELKKEDGRGISSFSANHLFSITALVKGGIYDVKGEKIIDGNSVASGNGKVGLKIDANKLTLLKLHNKKILKVYNIPTSRYITKYSNFLSYKGRFIVLRRKSKVSYKQVELTIIDAKKNRYWRTTLTEDEKITPASGGWGASITKDEKFMVLQIDGKENHILRYYQLYQGNL